MTKKWVMCAMGSLFLLGGCAYQNFDPAMCSPETTYDTIVVLPVNGDAADVPESKYAQLVPRLALDTTERLTDQLQANRLFSRAMSSSSCADRGISVQGKINSLVHRHSEFHVNFTGRIVNCRNGETLYRFDGNEEVDQNEINRMPGRIADRLFSAVRRNVPCRKSL